MKQIKSGLVVFLAFGILSFSIAFGQSLQDIEMLRKLAADQGKETITEAEVSVEDVKGLEPTRSEIELPELDFTQIDISAFFGYDFFNSVKMIELLNNLPVPANYMLGPGDEIVITLWGETEFRSKHVISRDNTIYIRRVGLLNLSGKSIKDAETFLKGQLERVYSTLKGPNPRTFFDVSIGKLKSVNVRFVGEVSIPGLYPIHPFSTVTTGLMQAGGIKKIGTLRNIQVIRNGRKVVNFDMYAFLQEGLTAEDIRLRDQDVVFVPVRHSSVSIEGEVYRTGIYELLQSESLADLVTFSAGLKPSARSMVSLKRIKSFKKRITEDSPIETFYIDIKDLSSWPIQDGDSLSVFTLLPETLKIKILGQVKNPGTYYFVDGMRLLDALKLAGGIEDSVFWKSIHHDEGHILRRSTDDYYFKEIHFNPKKLREGDQSENILIENGDQIILSQSSFYRGNEQVLISGEVLIPGIYSLDKNNVSLLEIINKAGGLTNRAYPKGLIVMRNSLRVINISNLNDLPLRPGDEIIVPRSNKTVEVIGEVYNSGIFLYDKKKSVYDYIEAAGGFTEDARKNNISIKSPNGNIKIKQWFSFPKIYEGTTIMVYRKKEKEPFDMTKFLTETTSILASLATVYVLISR